MTGETIDLTTLAIPERDVAMELMTMRHVDACVGVAQALGIFTALGGGPIAADTIAQRASLDPEMVARLLLVLAAIDIVRRVDATRFALTADGAAYFDHQSPFSAASFFAIDDVSPSMHSLLDPADSGWSVTRDADKSIEDGWRDGDIDAQTARKFAETMHAYALAPALSIVRGGVFAKSRAVLDLGGGSGTLCAAIKAHQPETDVALFDMPVVCDVARDHLARFGCDGRVTRHPGHFFRTPWPAGADTHVFSHILHNWPIADVGRLLELSRQSLAPGGRIVVIEAFIDPDFSGPLRVLKLHLSMWAYFKAQQFTEQQLSDLLIAAGFEAPTLVHRFRDYGVMEAYRP